MKHYAKKSELLRAVQWLGGEKSLELIELLGQRGRFNAESGQLELGSGWYARTGDWICSASGEDLSVLSDKVFCEIYEEVDESDRVPPTDNEHEAACQAFVRVLDVLLLAGLKLSREEHPSVFRERDRLVRTLHGLLEDQAYLAARSERQRIKERIVKEIVA